jgi:hypothetical protein
MRKKLTAAAVAATTAATALTGAPAYAADPPWQVAQVNTLPGEDAIKVVTVAPTASTWAAGYQTVDGKEVPFVQHLTSKGWTTVARPSGLTGEVNAITASYSKNVWVFTDDHAAHWNGTKWSNTSMPSGFRVSSAAAVSTNNVWAVSGQAKYAEHWTGSSWKKVTLPAAAESISAVSATRIYATGAYKGQPAVMHWNGSTWALAHTPTFKLPDPDAGATMRDILALSSADVYAVGGMEWACGEDGDDVCAQPLILHWDGKSWSSTTMAKSSSAFLRVSTDGANGIWLLQGAWNPQLWHISGDLTTNVAAPRPSGHDIDMTDLATNGVTVWAGGVEFPEGDPDDPTGNGLYLRTG